MQCRVGKAPVRTAQSKASNSAEHRTVAVQLSIKLASVTSQSASRVLVSSNRAVPVQTWVRQTPVPVQCPAGQGQSQCIM
jgi:hypothetical protein